MEDNFSDIVLNRVKKFYNLNSDRELAQFLKLQENTLYSWRKRKSVKWEVLFERCKEINLNYLVRGVLPESGKLAVVSNVKVVSEADVSYVSSNEILLKENQELKSRLEECRELVVRVSAGQRNVIYGGKVAATPPEED